MNNELQTTSWDNSHIYSSFQDPKIQRDISFVEEKTTYLKSKILSFEALVPAIENKSKAELEETIPLARETYRLNLDLLVSLYTLGTFAHSATSADALDYDAKNLGNRVSSLMAQLNKATKPLNIFLQRVTNEYLENFLKDESVDEMTFQLRFAAQEKDYLLNVSEEILLTGHAVDGFQAWGKLYSEIAGALKVQVDNEEMGIAQASNILFKPDSKAREVAYRGINKAWQQNEISANAILNSISGWRLENYQARSKKKELHYLDQTCRQQKISRKTLDTLMQTTYEQRHIGQKALKLMAKELGLKKLGPWDLLAPYPANKETLKISFPKALDIIIQAFGNFSPEMADFAKLMHDKRWIDSSPTANRGSGAYCTKFARNREPRVFMTYDGTMSNVITLAHELGHAYHNWVMKDLKLGQASYPSTLAETASIFAETLVRDAILENSKSVEEKKAILWQEVESAASFMINIPARFEFEKNHLELRKKKTLTVPETKELSKKSWELWYEDTLTEYNEMFWASKLHFSMTHMSFYNYPYLFGYLFSLGIYAKKNELGNKFKDLYTNVLLDTGSMTAEDLIQKHFNEDISKKDFWMNSFGIVKKSIDSFETLGG